MRKISVIVPAYNEEQVIAGTIRDVLEKGRPHVGEVIVVDGGSTDATVKQARESTATVVVSPRRGRAAQMNYGADIAGEQILYFLHADSHPPENYAADIISACENNVDAGCFRLAFDHDHFLLKSYAWCTRFDIDAFRFGDQSLFVQRQIFAQAGGFREDHIVMEDQEIVRRIKRKHSFKVLPSEVTTSARKYRDTGILKLQGVFLLIFTLYWLGASQQKLVEVYERWVS